MSVLARAGERDAFAELSRFRTAFYGSLTARADAFFELTDALLCADGPTRTPVELSLLAEHRRGYGSLYGALNHGRSKAAAQIIPGWPFSFVAALTPDRTSWTAVLDAVRLGPEDDAIAVTAHQLRQVVERLIRAGQWSDGDRDVLVVMDAGYDVTRLALLLSDLPVELVGRLRSDRVLRLPKPPRVYDPKGGRPAEHGPEFRLAKPETWPEPAVVTMNDTPRYGKAEARAWDRVHPRLTHRSAWKKCLRPSVQFLGWALRSVVIGASGGLHRDVGRRRVEVEAGRDGGLPAGAPDGHPGTGLVDLGGSLLSSCAFFDRRVVSLGVDGLRVLAAGGVGGNVVIGRVAVVVGRMVFVFPGRGSQWVGMACELVGGSLVFAARMDECGQVLEPFTDWRLADVLGDVDVLERAEVVQSVVWAVVVWLAAVWRSLGVVPDAVLGHSRGEVAAAVVAGALLLEEGACVVALCAGTLRVLAGCGGMTSLVLSAREAGALIGPGLSVAAVIGSLSVVVVGAPEALAELEVLAGERDVRACRLPGFCASAMCTDRDGGRVGGCAA